MVVNDRVPFFSVTLLHLRKKSPGIEELEALKPSFRKPGSSYERGGGEMGLLLGSTKGCF